MVHLAWPLRRWASLESQTILLVMTEASEERVTGRVRSNLPIMAVTDIPERGFPSQHSLAVQAVVLGHPTVR